MGAGEDAGRRTDSGRGRRGRRTGPPDTVRGRLKAHDPFELIRWLALSQPDPRKALAELVQNSLDAGAGRVRVKRVRHRGIACLSITDDGEGIIPEMSRPDALRHIATNIGHSRKRSLSPKERLDLMTQGQYGIGLLGFWSLGGTLEMRTMVPGTRPYRLLLHRDRPDFLVEPLRGRLPLEQRWTEILVLSIHKEALPVLGGRRAADYLASELRGQLLARDVELVIEDRMSRGRSQKIILVNPPRFLGERLEGIGPIAVPGHPPIQCEIYLSGAVAEEGEPGGLAIYGAGTLVAAGFHELAALGLDRPPFTDRRLKGLIDFPGFRVAPGSRRGFVPDAASGAFARAMIGIEEALIAALEGLERRRAEELDRTMIRDLQRAFRDFYRHSPRYKMLPVGDPKDKGAGPGSPEAQDSAAAGGDGTSPGGHGAATPHSPEPAVPPVDDEPPAALLSGPLHSVRLTPSPLRVECLGTRRARATALDERGMSVTDPVTHEWSLEGPVGRLVPCAEPHRMAVEAADRPAEGTLRVIARSEGREARAEVPVEVVEEIASRGSDEGIPEPKLIDEPGASWRSRIEGGHWQVNTGRPEYREIAGNPSLKLRYLSMLFAKEIVLQSSQDPRLDRPLEQLVEVAAYADRHLSVRRRRSGRPPRTGTEPT